MLVNVGDTLAGKYRVDRILGIGGMGMVVAATNMDLDQRVALKFMLPDAMQNETAMERFLREGKSAARLRSEHICRVMDVGRLHTGAPYIVMEYMEGGDFSGLIKRRGTLAVWEAVDYVLQALEGLAEAHANQIVHRDLKPGNLFVSTDNDGSPLVKVLDFGISKSTIGGASTKTGDIMGSPAYMSPEQMASAKNVDARADIWAMGVILYQAVCGRLPFEADTLPGLCMAVMNGSPADMVTLRMDMSPAFAAVVMKCLEKKPELRPGNVAELAALLAPFGGAGAPAAATRIAKVLGRNARPTPAMGLAVAQPLPSGGLMDQALVAPTVNSTGAPASARVSTLQASASEISYQQKDKKSKRMGVIIGAAVGTLVVGGIVLAATFGGNGSEKPAAAKVPTPVVEPTPQPEAKKPDPPAPPPPPPVEEKKAVEPPPAPPPPPVEEKKVVEKKTTPPPPVVRKTTTPPPIVKKSTTPPPPVEEKKTVTPPPVEEKKTTTPPVDPDDKWTHMQHDKDGKK